MAKILHSNFGTPEWESGDSNHIVPDIIEFLWASGIHKNTGVMACDESIAHCTKWFADRGYSLHDVPVKGYIEEALADPDLEPGYREGLELYLTEYRSILFVLGRHGLEDVPDQWEVRWQHRDETNVRINEYKSEEECLDFIRERLATWEVEELYDAITHGKINYKGQDLQTKIHLDMDSDLSQYGSKTPFYVKSTYGDFSKECTKKNVKAAIQEAIDTSRLALAQHSYFVFKRVIPVGDPKWGNWWRPVRVKSI
jgi:hypothetical protein